MLCGLLLTTAELTAYPLERPLILCRTVLAFLTGMSPLVDRRSPQCQPGGFQHRAYGHSTLWRSIQPGLWRA